MSGFTKRDNINERYSYANIMEGQFHLKCKESDEGAVSRTNKNKQIVWEQINDTLEDVFIHKVEERESDYGKQLQITCRENSDNSGKFFVIQCSLNSGYAFTFLSRITNVELDKPITLKVFEILNNGENGEYKTRSLTISQNGKTVDKLWTKENNPCPAVEVLKDKKGKEILKAGKKQYDDSARVEFLSDFINKEVLPDIIAYTGAKISELSKPLTMAEMDEQEQKDDLPF